MLAASTDLPFGTLASPGAGMLPTVVIVLMLAFAVVLLLGAGASPPLGAIAWTDAAHALRVIGVTAAAVAALYSARLYRQHRAVAVCSHLLVERKPFVIALAFSGGATLLAYLVFGTLLNAPLPRGLWH